MVVQRNLEPAALFAFISLSNAHMCPLKSHELNNREPLKKQQHQISLTFESSAAFWIACTKSGSSTTSELEYSTFHSEMSWPF